MAVPIVPDSNPPLFPNGPIDPGFRVFPVDPLPTVYYVLEQIKCKKNNQVWISARSTKDINDGLFPVLSITLNEAVKKWGKGNFVKTQLGVFTSPTDLNAQLQVTQAAVTTISKNSPAAVGNLSVGIINGISSLLLTNAV